jgi:hypothetical protein
MDIFRLNTTVTELPIKVLLSLKPIHEDIKRFASDELHACYKSSKIILEQLKKHPELLDGIEDLSQLEKHKDTLELFFRPLFPDLLQDNEIKVITMPFTFEAFHPSKRFAQILENAGDDFEFNLSGFNIDKMYLYACSFILAKYYGRPILKVSRPTYLDIPDQKTGQMKHYRLMFNADHMDLIKTDKAPDLTDEEIDELLLFGNDIEKWKEKFPPGSFIAKGFGIINLFDTTQDVIISKIRSLFLRKDEDVFTDFEKGIQELFAIPDLRVGISMYNTDTKHTVGAHYNKKVQSVFIAGGEEINYETMFCQGINSCVIDESKTFAIPDIEFYGNRTNYNFFYQKLKQNNIGSLILIPIYVKGQYLQIIEVASVRKNELNMISAARLEDIIPFIKIAAERYLDESENEIESTIQENYTSIHPAVKWRFTEAANNYNAQKLDGEENPILEDIVFENVYPLYGQSDIVASSAARNNAIQKDLEKQLSLVINTFKKVRTINNLPIYKKLIFTVQKHLKSVKQGLNAGDEVAILDFLKREIYPVFNHIMTLDSRIEEAVKSYMTQIDPDLKVVYECRKAYEQSVTMLNEKLAGFLDKKQEEAQKMFPHYFERYKTDGVEYNMYIGNTLVNDREFASVYLHNLRLWQLEIMCEIENIAYDLVEKMPYSLRVASLILVHSSPLAIKFRMDEKQFDVDGAYNVRYEIVKKRIDKSHIKGTSERLTQAGKIAIVYSNDNDVEEYLNYIEYLQSEKLLGKVEMLELEDLQGVSGLKAIRVEVIYNNKNRKNVRSKKSIEKMVADLGIVTNKN